ncbi:heavy metal-binding domain-containing protein [Paraflavitalea speifideaquila]|uniref:heavy metal-binding domain-containing protein n=1 Tax=Paraflavitalea speifideaquila TaxID=3076558 RepID=UPI003312F9F1
MQKLLIVIILLFMSPFIWAQQGSKKQEQTVVYTCVMHPEVQMSKPGNCPTCGMKLVGKK